MGFGSVGLTGGLYSEIAGTVGVHLGRVDPNSVYDLSRLRGRGYYSDLSSHRNPTRICRSEQPSGPKGSINEPPAWTTCNQTVMSVMVLQEYPIESVVFAIFQRCFHAVRSVISVG